ncbi:hypothetical protein [Mameliella sp.]|uniref:hypothetical protein n=1 Tax=Mameliella sp. TaxID=1924940 RepID=UPI003BABE7DE
MGATGQPDAAGHLIRDRALVYGADEKIAQWVGKRIPTFQVMPGARAIGVIKGKRLVAGVVYERYNGIHLEASIAALPGSRWADRHTLRGIFAYPFIDLNCRAISVVVGATNLESLNLATKLGFWPEAIVKFAAPDGADLVVLKLLREQCRWIQDGQGRQRTLTALADENGGG